MTHAAAVIPDHVPPELFWKHSLAEFTLELDDPYVAGSRLHEGPDILWARDVAFGRSGWMLTRHALIQEVFIDHERFTADRSNLADLLGVSLRLNPLEYDPPVHRLYRQILNPFFSPQAVNALEQSVRAACDELITKFEDRGSCEFIADFGALFPAYVFLAMMGMARDQLPQLLEWEEALLRGTDPMKRVAAARGILRYLEGHVAEQRKQSRSATMQGLLGATFEGRPLNEGELLGMIYNLYIGGLDTVYSSLGWHFRYLAGDPALQRRLRSNPQDIPRAVDELLRAFGVVAPHRMVAKDLVFHGVEMRKGDEVHLPTYLASRDPRAFANPHTIDIDRRPGHSTFGTGPHLCLGRYLARMEIKTVLESFLLRFENIRLQPGAKCEYHTGAAVGLDRLPLTWDRVK